MAKEATDMTCDFCRKPIGQGETFARVIIKDGNRHVGLTQGLETHDGDEIEGYYHVSCYRDAYETTDHYPDLPR